MLKGVIDDDEQLYTGMVDGDLAPTFPFEVTAEVLAHLAAEKARGLAPASLARRLAALRGFFRFLAQEGRIPVDPTSELPGPKRSRPLPKLLSVEQVEAFARVWRQWDGSGFARRSAGDQFCVARPHAPIACLSRPRSVRRQT